MSNWVLSDASFDDDSWKISATADNGHSIVFAFRTEPNDHDREFILDYVSYLDADAEAGGS